MINLPSQIFITKAMEAKKVQRGRQDFLNIFFIALQMKARNRISPLAKIALTITVFRPYLKNTQA
jgi:hypothetical protein